jgi:hypothetical protein
MWWDVVYGRSHVRVQRCWTHVDTQKSNTILLAVPIALTSRVKMNCIAIFALLCCTWWLLCMMYCGGLLRMDESRGTDIGTGTPVDRQRGITTVIGAPVQRFWRFRLHGLRKTRWTALPISPCFAVLDDFGAWCTYCGRLWRTSDSRGTGTGTPVDRQRQISTTISAIQRFWRFQLCWLWKSS